MDGGDTVEPPLLAELLSSDRTLLLQTTPLNRRAPPGDSTGAWSRGMLTLRLTLTTAMVEPTPDTAMAVLAMVVLATDMAAMARDLLTLRLMLSTATAVLTPDTAMAVLAMAMAVLATDMAAMARGLLTLRLTLITATVALTPDTAMAVWATAMAVLATDTASVLRTPMPTTAMAVTADTDLDTPLAMVIVDTATSDKSAKGWCRELQPIKICSISKLGIGNKPCFLEIRYFLMCIFMDKKTKCDKK